MNHRLVFFLLIALLPVQLGLHFWPAWSMVLGRRIDYLSPTLFLTDILIVLMLLFWFIEFRIRFRTIVSSIWEKKEKRYYSYVSYASISILLNIFFSLNPAVAVYHWVKFAEYALLFVYIVKTKPRVFLVTCALSLPVCYSSFIAIAQVFLQHSVGGLFWWFGERTFSMDTPGIAKIVFVGREYLRAYGTFPHPNVLGGFLAVSLPFIFFSKPSAFFDVRNEPALGMAYRMFHRMTIAMGLLALFFTFSRSAWFVCAMLVGLRATTKKYVAGIALGFVVGIVAWFVPISLSDESVTIRIELLQSAINMWRSAPFFGVGLGNFLVALPHFLVRRSVYFLQPVHSLSMLLLSQLGVVGICFVGLFFWFVRRTIRLHPSFLGLLLLGCFDHYPFTLQQGQLLFTIFLALSIG